MVGATSIMISLVGEQPIPNLLAARHFVPTRVVLAFTEKVKPIADRLRGLLKYECEVHCLQVSEFDLQGTQSELTRFINEQGWREENIIFNLTGGTKIMNLAAYRLASEWRRPFIYVESDEEPHGQVYRYEFSQQGDMTALPPESIKRGAVTLEEYLKAHIGPFTCKPEFANDFEQAVFETLKPHVNRILHGILPGPGSDIDIAFHVGNQVGVAQLKTKTTEKEMGEEVMQQLSLHTHREVLGTYTKRFAIVSARAGVHFNLRTLAQAFQAKLIELPSYTRNTELSNEDQERLIREVLDAFG